MYLKIYSFFFPYWVRYAVITGGNKGIGFEICKQLASNGVVVVLTARDQNRGLEAVEKLKESNSGFSDSVIFHQLDVTDPNSIASLAHFVKTHFGKLDILVNSQIPSLYMTMSFCLLSCGFTGPT